MVDQRQWHLEKSISVGHIVTTLSIAVGLVLAWADVDNRIDLNGVEVEHQAKAISRIESKQEKDTTELVTQIQQLREESQEDNRRTQEKLDRLIERELNGR